MKINNTNNTTNDKLSNSLVNQHFKMLLWKFNLQNLAHSMEIPLP